MSSSFLFWFLTSEKNQAEMMAEIQPNNLLLILKMFLSASFIFTGYFNSLKRNVFVVRQFSCGDEESFFGPQDEGGNMKWISACQAIFVNCKEVRYGTR